MKTIQDTMGEATISTSVALKNLAYIPAVLIGLSPESYIILTIFMFIDLCLGVLRSATLHGLQSIKSYKLTAGVISKMVVLTVPLILVWAGKGAGFDFTLMGQWAIGALVLSQAYSMLGHVVAIAKKDETSEWDAVSFVLKKLRTALEAILVDSHNKEKP